MGDARYMRHCFWGSSMKTNFVNTATERQLSYGTTFDLNKDVPARVCVRTGD